jgi:hypothetical protein
MKLLIHFLFRFCQAIQLKEENEKAKQAYESRIEKMEAMLKLEILFENFTFF